MSSVPFSLRADIAQEASPVEKRAQAVREIQVVRMDLEIIAIGVGI